MLVTWLESEVSKSIMCAAEWAAAARACLLDRVEESAWDLNGIAVGEKAPIPKFESTLPTNVVTNNKQY